MKKIITLLFSFGAFATSFAQYNHQQDNDDRNYRNERKRDGQYANSSNDNRNYNRHDKDWRYSKENNYSAREREIRIERINYDYACKVQAIQNDHWMRRREKKAALRNAEIERSRQLQMVNARFNYNNR